MYFLFDDSEDESKMYIGQSINGINRIGDHYYDIAFWSYAILFVTDNNSFNKDIIDYLEHKFIQEFRNSSYVLKNSNLRGVVPTISKENLLTTKCFIEQIVFLLSV